MDTDNLSKILDWDTQFFGVRIARLIPSRIAEPILQQSLNWCRGQSVECLYFLADSDHSESVHLAQQNGFNLVDIRMTFERKLCNTDAMTLKELADLSIRSYQLEDLPYLKNIARKLYVHSRFYYDTHFQKERAEALYMTWVEKSCQGYADKVLVLQRNREPIGYITCDISDNQIGSIGLIGVHQALQGRGAGQYLVRSALQWFNDQGVRHVEVVTQGRNYQAQRLYQRCDFITKSVQLWYHKWFTL